MPKVVLVTLVWLALAACNDPSQGLFSEARRAMEADNYQTAARLYQEITIQAPDSPLAADAHYELAQIYYLRLRNVDAAKDILVKMLDDYPDSSVDIDARLLLARLYDEDLQDPQRAVRLYRALLAEDLDKNVRRQTLLEIAHCHYRMGELDASADAYRLALGLPYHRDTDAAYMRLANLEWLGGSADESLRLLRELEKRTSDDDYRHEAMLSEVEVLMSLGRFAAARERVLVAGDGFPESAAVAELAERLRATELQHQSLDGEDEEALLQELQKKIRWGGGRRRRSPKK
ncbi:MAG: hypothetical protein BMS9Abin37_0116 [Acidobacteriota bacterium]|nr:MAG: hypothetical protein BMS9Abin37_0116 [Acidobacteriota bacterium]